MTTPRVFGVSLALAIVALALSSARAMHAPSGKATDWDAKAAAAYLDGRAEWWSTWPNAKRDHGTFCISCHTTLPYALARPVLRRVLGEPEPAASETKILSNLLERARQWRDIEPFYPDQTRGVPKTSESRAIESVMNALVLSRRDAERGHLSEEAKTALANMWALQMKTGPQSGAWTWLNFGYEPWESPNSPYFGASLAALAVGSAPDQYASSPDIQDRLTQLRAYFQKQFEHESLHNRLTALWASSAVPDLLTADQRRSTIDQALALQQSDGGWSSPALGPYKRVDNTPNETGTDAYATALAVLALQSGGLGPADSRVAKGLEWLRGHQDRGTGRWLAVSLNKNRDPDSDPGKFMNDAATAYAVLALTAKASATLAQFQYPPSKTVDVADTYFGTTYKDPYRWLEDLKDPAVSTWFKSQAELTDSVLAKIPARDALAEEWTRLDKLQPARYSAFAYEHGRLFYKKTLGTENVGKLYVRDGWTGAERLLFDPATFTPKVAKPGDVTTIQTALPSPDGRFVALGFSAAGSEFSEIRVLDVDRAELLPESFYPSYGPLGWTMDSRSMFYDMGKATDIKSQDIELNRQTRLHTIGTPVSADADFFSDESYPALGITDKEFPQASIDESSPAYVTASVSTVQNEMRVFYAPTAQMKNGHKMAWRVLCNPTDHLVRGLTLHRDFAYAVTYAGAPEYKLVRTSVTHPDWPQAETVIPEAKDSIQYITKSKDFLFVVYSDGIVGRIVKYSFDAGKTSQLNLPASGTADILCPDVHSNRCLVSTTSWTQPVTLWDMDGDADRFVKSSFNTPVTYPGFDDLVSEEVQAPSYDGTMVPLSIVHRKNLKLDGSTSAILEGYGSYGISHPPAFDVRFSVALHDVVLGYCHVRGGGEKGEDWYKAGYKATKPNTWKDFIACAEYLMKQGYTSPARLAATGRSAGGILISRAITERPDLFAAAVCNVGVANALRGEFSANGPVNIPEFGTVKDPAGVKALAEMDGLSHVQPGVKYPAVLGVAGWNDPRVDPWQPGKFVAALQAASASGRPVLLKVNYDDGHFTEEKTVTFKNFAGQFAFLLWQTGHQEFQPTK